MLVGRAAPDFTAPAVLANGDIVDEFNFQDAIKGKYAVELPDGSVAFRGSFLIDLNGTVRHQVVNDLPLGRNVDEMIRMVDTLQFTEEHGEVCPAGWNKGDKGMTSTPDVLLHT